MGHGFQKEAVESSSTWHEVWVVRMMLEALMKESSGSLIIKMLSVFLWWGAKNLTCRLKPWQFSWE